MLILMDYVTSLKIRKITNNMKDYKKILEGIVNIISNTEKSDTVSNICSYIDENCPELTESKDERIKKQLLNWFKSCHWDSISIDDERLKRYDILAWLERQQDNNKPKPSLRERYKKMTESEWFKKTYEDKSCGIDNESVNNSNKVKPRFHIGEWIIFNGSVLYINEVVQGYYKTISRDSIYNSYDWDIDYAARLWTIEEAKDGDILTSHECYAIFKEIDGLNIRCYCTFYLNVGSIPMFHINTLQNKAVFCPVVKEERELFLEKINEFGYKWDSENKKLIKI